jgi:hypothetical protein
MALVDRARARQGRGGAGAELAEAHDQGLEEGRPVAGALVDERGLDAQLGQDVPAGGGIEFHQREIIDAHGEGKGRAVVLAGEILVMPEVRMDHHPLGLDAAGREGSGEGHAGTELQDDALELVGFPWLGGVHEQVGRGQDQSLGAVGAGADVDPGAQCRHPAAPGGDLEAQHAGMPGPHVVGGLFAPGVIRRVGPGRNDHGPGGHQGGQAHGGGGDQAEGPSWKTSLHDDLSKGGRTGPPPMECERSIKGSTQKRCFGDMP